MTRDRTDSRAAVLGLTLRFSSLMMILMIFVGFLVFALVSRSSTEADTRALVEAAQIDSPQEAPAGIYATVVGSPRRGDGTSDLDGKTDKGGNTGSGYATGIRSSENLPAGLPDVGALARVAASQERETASIVLDGRSYALLTTPNNGSVVQVAVDQQESGEELSRLAWALVGSILVATVIAAASAFWMARRAMRPMAEALALQRRFVADASHELRTPLTLLSTRAQLLRRQVAVLDAPELSAPLATGVDEIIQDSRLLNEILEDLLISADPRENSTPVAVDLGSLAAETIATLTPAASRKNITLTQHSDENPQDALGSPVALKRLLISLVSNALDHASSAVRVDIGSGAKHVTLRVTDDGPGFPAEMRGREFERFASARATDAGPTVRHYGLGLALVADVAHQHGGDVSVAPASSDGGARVTVRLPRSVP